MNSRKPKEGWQQQNCSNFMFIPSRNFAICLYVFIAVSNLTLGGVLFKYSADIRQFRKEYSCGKEKCTIEIDIEDKIPSPVYFYYEIENYYQNHRIYVKSRSSKQLAGNELSSSEIQECDPVTKIKDLDWDDKVLENSRFDKNDDANPCGLIAKSYFKDRFSFDGKPKIKETGIAWPSDLEDKFKNTDNWKEVQWTDVEDEHFIVWMRIAATNNFIKLWGKIDEDMEGKYSLKIEESMDFSEFDGKKYILLSNANSFGGKNNVLVYALFISGGLASIWTMVFIFYPFVIKKH
jgi:hypothetical protein